MEKTKYKLKCGLNSEELIIEFEDVSNKLNFANSFSNLINKIDGNILDIEKGNYPDDILYLVDSEIGAFRISSDNYGSMIILPDKNQNVIYELDLLFKSSKYFQSIEN